MATATSKLKIIIDVVGDQAERSLGGINKSLLTIGATVGAVSAAIVAAKKVWDFAKEGAELQLTETQFNNVATAAGYMSDVLLSRMRKATDGLVSDAELMRSGLDIIELGLADSEDGVVRLATVVSTLGLDMQQVILTFANNSEMRLDALGLSVEGVRQRVAELNAEGFDGDAFDQAVLEGLEQRMATLGDTAETSAGKIQRFETQWKNFMDGIKLTAIDAVLPTLDAALAIQDVEAALEAGLITQAEYNDIQMVGRYSSEAYAQALDEIATKEQELASELAFLSSEASDADAVMLGYASATKEAGDAAADAVDDHASLNQELLLAGKAYSDVSTNIYSATQALQERLDFLTGGGAALVQLEQAAREAMDEANWNTAQYYLDLAAEGAIDLDMELGNIDPTEAAARLMELGYGPQEAQEKVQALQSSVFALTSRKYNLDIYINTHGSMPSVPGGGTKPSVGNKKPYASGTGGWMEVPGPSGAPYPVTLHGGEAFNVVNPARGQSAGGNTVNWYGDAVFTTAGEAMAFIANMQSQASRNARSAMAGAGYVGQ